LASKYIADRPRLGKPENEGTPAMLKHLSRLLFAFLLFAIVVQAHAKEAAAQSIEGVWKPTEIVQTGAGAYVVSAPQPGMIIFTKSHFSWIWGPGSAPRPLFKAAVPTKEEKLAAFDALVASSGTYELNGSTATFRHIVSKSPNAVSISEQFLIEGDTLTLTWTSSDTRVRVGQDVVPLPVPAYQGRMKLVRVE
jgi:hypothetical protein